MTHRKASVFRRLENSPRAPQNTVVALKGADCFEEQRCRPPACVGYENSSASLGPAAARHGASGCKPGGVAGRCQTRQRLDRCLSSQFRPLNKDRQTTKTWSVESICFAPSFPKVDWFPTFHDVL
ncbi:hypothetical protein WJX72_011003 [[Myrmecia] bisecta]|uniref:Uncharacterized protein n=1 Tax=[Myrmecia] bisecta TaxID=41462 RepID=A0AAW1QSS9_9CHLO